MFKNGKGCLREKVVIIEFLGFGCCYFFRIFEDFFIVLGFRVHLEMIGFFFEDYFKSYGFGNFFLFFCGEYRMFYSSIFWGNFVGIIYDSIGLSGFLFRVIESY